MNAARVKAKAVPSLIAVLNNPDGRRLVDAIDDVSSSLRSYPNGEPELERVRASLVAELYETHGYFYSSEASA